MVGFPKATYMYWQKRFDRVELNKELEDKILTIHMGHKDFGYCRMQAVLLSRTKPDSLSTGKSSLEKISERAEAHKPKERVTYQMIKDYIEEKYGFEVHTAYLAEVKRELGLPMHDAPNAVEELKKPEKHPTRESVEAIKDALRYFQIFSKMVDRFKKHILQCSYNRLIQG